MNKDSLKSTVQIETLFLQRILSIDLAFQNILQELKMQNAENQLRKLMEVRSQFFDPIFQVNRRKIAQLSNGFVIDSPYGYLWFMEPFDIRINCGSLIYPTECLFAETFDDLEIVIENWNHNKIHYSPLLSQQVSNINHQVNIFGDILRRSSKLIPKYIKRILPS